MLIKVTSVLAVYECGYGTDMNMIIADGHDEYDYTVSTPLL